MMKIGKNMIIAIMITFCFTASLFMVIPIRSANQPYNPWLDYDENRVIGLTDLVALANSYGTTGDPTKNVNITNPTAMTLQEDLNISIINWTGWGSIDPFATAGYERMFVSAAVIDVSNYNSQISASLSQANWYWGLVNGKYLTTYTIMRDNESDSHGQVHIDVYNATTDNLPVSSPNTAEIPVHAGNCSLSFYASSSFEYGWVRIRVSIYLTFGTTSPPNVQNTYVTNMPLVQPQQSSASQVSYFNSAIDNYGHGTIITPVQGIGGYSRMFVSIEIDDASYQGPVTTTVSLGAISWNGNHGSFEYVNAGVPNVTYYGGYLPVYSQMTPPQFTTKGDSYVLTFFVNSNAYPGWVAGYVKVYLRNE